MKSCVEVVWFFKNGRLYFSTTLTLLSVCLLLPLLLSFFLVRSFVLFFFLSLTNLLYKNKHKKITFVMPAATTPTAGLTATQQTPRGVTAALHLHPVGPSHVRRHQQSAPAQSCSWVATLPAQRTVLEKRFATHATQAT